MKRRGRASRASRVVKEPTPIPTPIHSAFATPLSSAYPSAYPSEDESYKKQVVAKAASKRTKRPAKPFRFMDLPPELRLRVYGFHFAADDGVRGVSRTTTTTTTTTTLDLDPDNHKRLHRKMMALFLSCRAVYAEAGPFFYHAHTFRLFPCHPGRFFKTKRPLLSRLTREHRADLGSLELRLGPGWNKPPRGWVVNDALGLADCTRAHRLRVFVECDPGASIFDGFRRADGFYEDFSRDLLADVLDGLPAVRRVEFDAWPSVEKSGGMMRGLLGVVAARGIPVTWGPQRGWTDDDELDDDDGQQEVGGGNGGVFFGMDMARLNIGVPVLATTGIAF